MMQRRGDNHRHAFMLLATIGLLILTGCSGNEWSTRQRPTTAEGRPPLPDHLQTRLDEAGTAQNAGDYDAALAAFQEILAENPTVTSAYVGMGEIYLETEEYTRAEPAFARAARLEPRNFDAQLGHGVALQMLDRFVDAIRAYQRALAIDPESLRANLNLATTFLRMNDSLAALSYAQKAVEIEPDNHVARTNLGAAYENLGRNEDAIDEYLVAVELLEEPSPPLMINLINVLAREERYQEAANTAENLVRISADANAYERLGWVYFRMGQYELSIEAYRNGVTADPDHWPSLNGIGVNALNTWLLSERSDEQARREARTAFRTSLRVNTDQPKVVMLMSNYGL